MSPINVEPVVDDGSYNFFSYNISKVLREVAHMSGMLVAENLRLLLPPVLDEVASLLEESLISRQISRTCFTPRSAMHSRLARSLHKLRGLERNSAYTSRRKRAQVKGFGME